MLTHLRIFVRAYLGSAPGVSFPHNQDLLYAHGTSVVLKPGDALYVLSPLMRICCRAHYCTFWGL
jgi:hypothetical protein